MSLLAGGLLLFSSVIVSCGGSNNTDTTVDNGVDTLTSTNGDTDGGDHKKAEAIINATYSDTAATGNAVFTEVNGRVKLDVQLDIPAKANQNVAVHIHETGNCADTGMAAHGHWNPTNQSHGKWGEGEFHRGDIGNIQLDANGKGSLQMDTDLWNIGGDSTGNILDRAIIVHGGTDDYKTQPTGGAGNRIGCGVIKQM